MVYVCRFKGELANLEQQISVTDVRIVLWGLLEASATQA